MVATPVNPFLSGNFAPVSTEVRVEPLEIVGELPPDLQGMFIRNGPNPQFPPLGQYHWFDGDGMLHAVEIQAGRAAYQNRYVHTRGYLLEQQAGHPLWSGLLEPAQVDHPYGPSKNTANTAFVWHADEFLALWEGGEPHKIKLPELKTLGPQTYEGKLASAFTAHPKVDPVTGEMLFFGYSMLQPPYLQYGVVSAAGELQRTVPIDLPVGVMMHDFAVTEHYTLFLNLPLTFSLERMQRGEPPLMFEGDRPSQFGILPRHGDNSQIRWFEAPACYIFHTLNAYETGAEVVLIACRMQGTTVLGGGGSSSELESDIPRLHRWRFNLETGQVLEAALDQIPGEFPRMNEKYLGRPNRYGYLARFAPNDPLPRFDGLIKYDFETGTSEHHHYGSHCFGGEAVFVPRPDATPEDAGWLISFIHNEATERSELRIIDAQNLAAAPVARILLPHRVPYGFHGTWVDATKYA